MVTMLKNKCSMWKRIKFPTFWYNCYYFTWSDTYFIQLETLLINHPSYVLTVVLITELVSSLLNNAHFILLASQWGWWFSIYLYRLPIDPFLSAMWPAKLLCNLYATELLFWLYALNTGCQVLPGFYTIHICLLFSFFQVSVVTIIPVMAVATVLSR